MNKVAHESPYLSWGYGIKLADEYGDLLNNITTITISFGQLANEYNFLFVKNICFFFFFVCVNIHFVQTHRHDVIF